MTMRAVSASELAASQSMVLPEGERVGDGVWTVPMLMAGGHIPYSFCYLVLGENGGVHLIDPGSDFDPNWSALAAALARVDRTLSDVESVTVTHLHGDHLGMAQRVREATGAPVALHRFEQETLDGLHRPDSRSAIEIALGDWAVPPEDTREFESITGVITGSITAFTADVILDDGATIDIPGHPLRVLWTPGHTGGHICLLDEKARLLFTGDHLLPTVFPGLGLGGITPSNPLADYLRALRDIEGFDDHEVCPGHGYRFFGLRDRAAATAEHHLRRSNEIAAALVELDHPSVWQIAARVSWSAGWENLHGFYLYSALTQTAMHVEYLRELQNDA